MRLKTALIYGFFLFLVVLVVRFAEENDEFLSKEVYIFYKPLRVSSAFLISLLLGTIIISFLVLIFGTETLIYSLFIKFRERAKKESEIRYLKGMDAILGDRPFEALKHFSEALTLNPKYVPSLLKMGDTLRKVGRVEEAIDWHKKALDENPYNLEILYSLAEDYLVKEEPEEAKKYLNKIITIQPKRALHALRLLRNIFINEENFYKAKEIQQKILKASVLDEERREDEFFNLAIDYEIFSKLIENGRLEEAVLGLTHLTKKEPKFLPSYMKLAEAYLLLNEEELAISTLKNAFQRTEKSAPLLFLEKIYLEKGEPEECIRKYHELIEDSNNKVIPSFLLARLYFRMGFYMEAEKILLELENSYKIVPSIEYYLARINERKKEYEKACSYYNEMARILKYGESYYLCMKCGQEISIYTDYCKNCKIWDSFIPSFELELKDETKKVYPAYYMKWE